LLQLLNWSKRAYELARDGKPDQIFELWLEIYREDGFYPQEAIPKLKELGGEVLLARTKKLAGLWEDFKATDIAKNGRYDSDEVINWLYEKILADEITKYAPIWMLG